MQTSPFRNSPPPHPEKTATSAVFVGTGLCVMLLVAALSAFLSRPNKTKTNIISSAPPQHNAPNYPRTHPKASALPTQRRTDLSNKPLLSDAELPSLSLPLDVSAAYAAIPHRQTTFDASASTLPSPERDYLEKLFGLVDQGVSVRVSALQTLMRQRRITQHLQHYQQLLRMMHRHTAPPSLQRYHQLITAALQGQHDYLAQIEHTKDLPQQLQRLKHAPLVRQSSQQLRAAYGLLMQRFAARDPQNKTAFFDHLCALDFI